MIKHIIFDFDGTIVDSRYLAIELLNKLAEKHRFRKIKEDEIEQLRDLTVSEKCRAIRLPLFKLPLIILELKNNYRHSIGTLKVFDGVRDTILRLKQKGYKLSIISSNGVENIVQFLKNNQINLFDNIYSSSSLFGKDMVLAGFLKKHGLNKKEIIYIGDEHRDIVACRKIGVKVIAATWGFDTQELLQKADPDYIAHKPRDIIKILGGQT